MKPIDTTLEQVQWQCAATRKVRGYRNEHFWQLVLVYRNGDNMQEIPESAARFNTVDHVGVIGFWDSERALSSYLDKRRKNDECLKMHGRVGYLPYPGEMLVETVSAAADFDLQNIYSIIDASAQKFIETQGSLPIKPVLLPYGGGSNHWFVYLKIQFYV